MTKADRYRAKMVRGLVRALDDEESHLRRYRRVGTTCTVLGAVMFSLALFAAWGGSDAAGVWLVVSGAAGGLLIGLAVFFRFFRRTMADQSRVPECGCNSRGGPAL